MLALTSATAQSPFGPKAKRLTIGRSTTLATVVSTLTRCWVCESSSHWLITSETMQRWVRPRPGKPLNCYAKEYLKW